MIGTMKAGVVGAGVFGGYHAEKWATLPGATLVAVFDTDAERAAALAVKTGGEPFTDLGLFLESVDLVSIASPAVTHGALALQVLRAGKPVYVEKPLAVSLEDADAVAREASQRGLVVACGFLERVAFEAIGLLDAPTRPSMIEATRLGAPSARNQDVSVVLDLMIHDLDLVLALAGGPPLTVEAEGSFGETGLAG